MISKMVMAAILDYVIKMILKLYNYRSSEFVTQTNIGKWCSICSSGARAVTFHNFQVLALGQHYHIDFTSARNGNWCSAVWQLSLLLF